MENNVPYVAYESTINRFERTNRRIWILCIILIVALIATNAGWIIYESQFEIVEESTEEYEVVQDGNESGDNYFNRLGDGNGDVTNGKTNN